MKEIKQTDKKKKVVEVEDTMQKKVKVQTPSKIVTALQTAQKKLKSETMDRTIARDI